MMKVRTLVFTGFVVVTVFFGVAVAKEVQTLAEQHSSNICTSTSQRKWGSQIIGATYNFREDRIVKTSKAVKQSNVQFCTVPTQPKNKYVAQLVENGGDVDAAESLVERLTGGNPPADKFEAAAMQSFISMVATLTSSGGRLSSVR